MHQEHPRPATRTLTTSDDVMEIDSETVLGCLNQSLQEHLNHCRVSRGQQVSELSREQQVSALNDRGQQV